MLYVFHGTDVKESGRKAKTLIDSLRKKKPDAAFARMSGDNWNKEELKNHMSSQGLFSSKYIIFLDRVTENAEAKEEIATLIPALNESDNIFIVLEGKILADLKKAFEKSSEKVVISDEKIANKSFGQDFNIFSLADAFGSRDALRSWILYREAINRGHESESIIGTLFWQVKSMILASPAKSHSEAGLSPFVFSKSKKYASNYSSLELTSLAAELISMYHNGHRGMTDLEMSLERMLLKMGASR